MTSYNLKNYKINLVFQKIKYLKLKTIFIKNIIKINKGKNYNFLTN